MKHLTDTDLLHHMYGLTSESAAVTGHLSECPDCLERWASLAESRQELLRTQSEVPPDFLADQRQRIHARMEQQRPKPLLVRWSPAIAVASMAIAVLLWKVPLQKNAGQPVEIATTADAQLMTDIYKTVYDTEPDVVEPLRGLFDSKGTGGSQQ
ncbi:MAG: hypothetical protein HY820_09210 [Acidobacteria bacterium]|nr:hypothetical protein [Acidobacteriota bacterium]